MWHSDFDPFEVLQNHQNYLANHDSNFANLEDVINNHCENIDTNTANVMHLLNIINDLEQRIQTLEKPNCPD